MNYKVDFSYLFAIIRLLVKQSNHNDAIGVIRMANVEYGNWIIDVDLNKTKDYYSNYPTPEQNQIYMNYKKYCESMPEEERNFFSNFGIDPLCCQPDTIGITKEKTVPISAYFYVAGNYVKCHEEEIISIEELAENNFVDEREDPRINIGLFQFDFQNSDAVFNDIPEGIPDGFICIQVWIEALPWLLDDKCQTKMYYPPKWWQIFKRMKEAKQSKLSQLEYIEEIKLDLETDFKNHKISFELLSRQETKQLFAKWIEEFIPTSRKKEIKESMIYGNKRYGNYLWHAFSNDVIPTESTEIVPLCFSDMQKKQCFILLNNEKVAYSISDATVLDSSVLDKYNDILIFDYNFTWTYCHTHEEYCGPYFYNKKNPPPPYDSDAIAIIKSDDKNKYIEIFEKDGVFKYCVTQKCLEEYDGAKYYYWCPVNTGSCSFYDTKEKAIDEAKKLL